MLGFKLDIWDFATFVAILLALVAGTAVLLWRRLAGGASRSRASIRRIGIRTYSWLNWRYPVPF